MSTWKPSWHPSNGQDRRETSKGSKNPHPATVARTPDGDAKGVGIFLTADDLRQLGLDPEETEEVVPKIEDGVILVESNN